jgi:hypothetical protein
LLDPWTWQIIAFSLQKWFNTYMSAMHDFESAQWNRSPQYEWGFLRFQAGGELYERIESLLHDEAKRTMGRTGLFLYSQRQVPLERNGRAYDVSQLSTIRALQEAERTSVPQPKLARFLSHEPTEQGTELFRMAAMPGAQAINALQSDRVAARLVEGRSVPVRFPLAQAAFKRGALASDDFEALLSDVYGADDNRFDDFTQPSEDSRLYVQRPQFLTRPVIR